MAKIKVFISYRRVDAAFARLIHSHLEQKPGVDVFMDVENLSAKGSFPQEIQAAIRDRDTFLLVLGKETLESEWVRREIKTARHYKKPIIVVTAEGVTYQNTIIPDDVKFLADISWIPYLHQFADVSFQKIEKALGIKQQAVPYLPVLAAVVVLAIVGIAIVVAMTLSRGSATAPTSTVVAQLPSSPTVAPTTLVPTPVPSVVPTTAIPPSSTPTQKVESTVAPSATPTEKPTETARPRAYPCNAKIAVTSGTGVSLNEVKAFADNDAPARPFAAQGEAISALGDQVANGGKWYQIRYSKGTNIGWILDKHVVLSADCP